ncbi:unnamed protein product, partial [Hapterophycus canaliculatus]
SSTLSERLPCFRCVEHVTEKFGHQLRQFHENKLIRYSGHVDNYAYSKALGRVIMFDMDSTLDSSSFREPQLSLLRVRDIASGIYGILSAL